MAKAKTAFALSRRRGRAVRGSRLGTFEHRRFNETGSTMAALTGSSRQDDVGYSALGARAATSYVLPNGMTLAARSSVAWQHAFGDVTPDALLALQGSTAAFTVSGVPLARDAALVEAGFDFLMTLQIAAGISCSGQLAEGMPDHSVKGNLPIKF